MPAWDLENKFRLLLAIIELQNAPNPHWEKVAEKMGGGFALNACRYVCVVRVEQGVLTHKK